MRTAAVDWRLAAPLGIVYLALFAAPLLLLLGISLHSDQDLQQWGVDNWVKFWSDAFYLGVVWDTLRLGLTAVLATSLFAWPLAVFFCASSARTQKILLFIILLPLLTSVVIRTFAWIVILAREGLINQAVLALGLSATPLRLLQTETGLILALMQIEMPLMLLPLISVMRGLDPNLLDASRALGAGHWRSFFRVILPLSLPGWIAGATLVFASACTAFISQSVIGGARLVYLPSLIWQQAMVVYDWPFAAVCSVTLLFTVLAGVMMLNWLGRYARTD
jgi:putative spermidine/putrescine transport system permease protein